MLLLVVGVKCQIFFHGVTFFCAGETMRRALQKMVPIDEPDCQGEGAAETNISILDGSLVIHPP